MSATISKYNNKNGITLLEIMFSITIIGICVPFIFGILFTSNTIRTKITSYNDIKNIKNDIISFIKLTPFEMVYQVLNDCDIILIEEQHDPELSFRDVTISKFPNVKNTQPLYICRLFPFDNNDKESDMSDINKLCTLQMWCGIYKINKHPTTNLQKILQEQSNADILFPIVKLR